MKESTIVEHVSFKTTCLNCQYIFSSPVLSDFSYGEMIFTCECGKEFVTHSAISHPVTNIFELLCHVYKLSEDDISLWDFSAYFVDKSHFHRFKSTRICPACQSSNLSHDLSERMGVSMLKTASYNKLYSLSKHELFDEFERFLSDRRHGYERLYVVRHS